MAVFTVSITDGTTLANLAVAAGRGPKGDGFTGGSFNASTGIVTFTSNDGLGFATGDLRSDLSEPSPIGDVTPNTGAFTSLSTTGNTIIGGNLTVNGTTTTVNSQTLDVADKNITIAFGSVDAAAANGAGLTVDGADATLTYVAAGDKWVFNKPVDVTTLTATSADINGGTIDGVTIGGASAGAVTTTSLVATTADINGGSIDGTAINTSTIDGTVIGGSTPAAISGTTGQFGTSLNVDGTVTADGLTVDGSGTIGIVRFENSDSFPSTSGVHVGRTSGSGTGDFSQAGHLYLSPRSSGAFRDILLATGIPSVLRTRISSGGDISFFEDTGTTPKLFWDASAERLGIGTTTPTATLSVTENANISLTSGTGQVRFEGAGYSGLFALDGTSFQIGQNSGSRSLTFHSGSGMPERARIDASGNVGIGTSSPTAKLHVHGLGAVPFRWGDTSALGTLTYAGSDPIIQSNTGNLLFFGLGTERLRITSTGNVGIGTSSPAKKLSVSGADGTAAILLSRTTSGAASLGQLGFSTVNGVVAGIDSTAITDSNNGALRFFTTGGSPQSDVTALPERARIDASGRLLVGTTTTSPSVSNVVGFSVAPTGFISLTGQATSAIDCNRTNDGIVQAFRRGGVFVGSIFVTASATAYNTSSDYRLKEDVQPMVGASNRVLALNPVNFAWKVDGSRVDGFLAHEAQAVVPEAVTGEKDGEEMQAIDQSKLVPLLTAALQEALQKIDALEARITALEA